MGGVGEVLFGGSREGDQLILILKIRGLGFVSSGIRGGGGRWKGEYASHVNKHALLENYCRIHPNII